MVIQVCDKCSQIHYVAQDYVHRYRCSPVLRLGTGHYLQRGGGGGYKMVRGASEVLPLQKGWGGGAEKVLG